MISAPVLLRSRRARTALFLLSLMCLSACGIKPSDVSPPDGYTNSEFPRTYPNPNTDPAP